MNDPAAVQPVIVLVARCFLGGCFLLSALGKVRNLPSFIPGTISYQILPMPLARAFGYVLPWLELLLALALLAGVALPVAGMLTIGLVACFSIAVSINLRRGRAIACHCYGLAGTPTINWGTVVRNLLLMLAAGSLALLAPHVHTIEPWLNLWRADLALVTAGATGILLALLIGFGFVTLQLAEWTVHVHLQFTRLTEQVRR